MRKTISFTNVLTSLAAVFIIFCGTLYAAQQVVDSAVYRQSKLISMIVQQDSVGIASLVQDTRNIDLVVKFSGAIASAYINFELIPLNEASTFVAVFESVPDSVTVESFEYRRHNLVIYGYADSVADYNEFIGALRQRDYFDTISGHWYDSTHGGLRFEIECSAKTADAYLEF